MAEALGPLLCDLTLRRTPAAGVSLCNVTHFRRLQVSTGYQVQAYCPTEAGVGVQSLCPTDSGCNPKFVCYINVVKGLKFWTDNLLLTTIACSSVILRYSWNCSNIFESKKIFSDDLRNNFKPEMTTAARLLFLAAFKG